MQVKGDLKKILKFFAFDPPEADKFWVGELSTA
jgi:hypothetical protein